MKAALLSVFRHGLTVVGAAAVAKGYADADAVAAIVGGLVAAASLAVEYLATRKLSHDAA